MPSSQFSSVRAMLTEAVKRGATNVYFSVGNEPTLRLNGELEPVQGASLVDAELMEKFTADLLTDDQKKKFALAKEMVLVYDFDQNLRFKINLFYQRGLLSASMRHVPFLIPTVSALGLSPEILNLIKLKKGLVIVAGPYGSGRSTTAAAIIEEINLIRKEYIITIEDPIEHIFVNKKSVIEQREIGRDSQSFIDALRYYEEEDGDVLFLEKMEDPAIIPLVLEIARSSSLVVTTVTADSVLGAISRIFDSFSDFDQKRLRDLLANSLVAIVCQKLLPRVGGGVIVAQEIMVKSDAVRSLILEGNIAGLANVIGTSRQEGMIAFDQELVRLVKAGKISRETALQNSTDEKKLELMMK